MNIKMLKAALAGLVLSVSSIANAGLITFDGNGVMSNDYTDSYIGIGDTYTQGGFILSVGLGDHFDSMNSSGLSWHNGSANANYDNWAYLTYSGGLFDLFSFNFTQYSGDVLYSNTYGPVSLGIGSHTVNALSQSWVAFSPSGNGSSDFNFLTIDNISAAASAVPEPSTLAIFALGIMGLASRRFKKQ